VCLLKLGKAFEREESKEQSESEVMIVKAGEVGAILSGRQQSRPMRASPTLANQAITSRNDCSRGAQRTEGYGVICS
jgi:hypothetical protein